jgi:signal transduction histidine kinase
VALVETFAGQAALALERVRAQDEREQLAVLGDRERIARDLHDVVIQRLFAAGMQLQGAARYAARPEVRQRIDAVVDDLDATIRDIRGAIFELRAPARGEFRAEIRELVEEARGPLGFAARLVIDGPIDSVVPEPVRPALLAVLREALSNAARHARASAVTVTVAVHAGRVELRVIDDGIGIGIDDGIGIGIDDGVGVGVGGVRNMRRRAEELGGTCTVQPAAPTGTQVIWSVPG